MKSRSANGLASSRSGAGRFSALGLLVSAGLAMPAWAGVEGEQVVKGSASFHRNGKNTTITAANKTIINYSKFNIAADESVKFVQPSASSRVLNRISGADPTVVAGKLQSNGIVYIINPAGVYFRNGALVDVGGIYAAAGRMSNTDFLNNVNRFTDLAGPVVNEAVVNANRIAFAGANVVNQGTLSAPGGAIVMASGDGVFIGERNSNIFVRIDGPAGAAAGGTGGGVQNLGTLEAAGGSVTLASGDLYGVAIHHAGLIRAKNVALQGGAGAGDVLVSGAIDASNSAAGQRGGNVAVTGHSVTLDGASIDASGDKAGGTVSLGAGAAGLASEGAGAHTTIVGGESTVHADAAQGKGGDVRILGERVALLGADISASGAGGGGQIRVGGDVQGTGSLPTSRIAFVSHDSSLSADATSRGQGGRVIVFADDTTRVYGSITARGSGLGGRGGFVETSGKNYLDVRITPDVSSPTGEGGHWLLDPFDIEIVADGTLDPDDATGINDDSSPFESFATGSLIEVGVIEAALAMGDVTIRTGGFTGDGFDDGNIVLSTTLDFNGVVSSTLTLFAHNDIEINGQILDSVAGGDVLNLVLNADNGPSALRGGTSDGNGVISIMQSIDLAGGTFTASGAGFSNIGGTITTGGGDVSITVLSNTASTVSSAIDAGAGNLTFMSPGQITFSADLTADTSIFLHSGTDGIGNLLFSSNPVLQSDSIVLRAGDGNGGGGTGATARPNGSPGAPSFVGAGGAGVPSVFTLQNDGNITNARIPDASQFNGSVIPAMYTLQSDDGSITLSTASKVAGADLVMSADNGITVSVSLTGADSVASLDADGDNDDDGTGNVNLQGVTATTGNIEVVGAGATTTGVLTSDMGFVNLNVAGDVAIANDIVGFSGVSITAGNDGTGMLTFAGSPDIQASDIVLIAGNGMGTTASIDAMTGTPNFRGFAGGATSPDTFLFRQDAAITDANLPDGSQFGNGLADGGSPVDYTIESSGGSVTIGTASKVDDAALTLVGTGTPGVIINTDLMLESLLVRGILALNGSITTNLFQTYEDAVTVGADVTLASTGMGNIEFQSTLDADDAMNARNMSVQTGGASIFGADVGASEALETFGTDSAGTSVVAGNVTTNASQEFRDPMTLTGAGIQTFSGSSVLFSDVDADTAGLQGLDVMGDAEFTGVVGGASPLASVEVSGTTAIDGAGITTSDVMGGTGDQTYHGDVTVGFNTTLTTEVSDQGTGNIIFEGDLNADDTSNDRTLVVDAAGIAQFGDESSDEVGGGTGQFESIEISAACIDIFSGTWNTDGASMTFNNAVLLFSDVTLTEAGTGNVTFNDTIDSTDGSAFGLTVNTGSGATIFNGAIGSDALGALSNDDGLGSLTTDANGSTQINGGLVTTTGAQNYNDATTLDSATDTTTLNGSTVAFGDSLGSFTDGEEALLVNAMTTTLTGFVGGTNARLASLETDAAGTTTIGPGVTTVGAQTYHDDVVIAFATVLTSSDGADIVFNGDLNADDTLNDRTLEINTSGVTRIGDESSDAVGNTGLLADFTTDAAGRTEVYASTIMANGTSITFNDAVLLFVDLTITELTGDVTFGSTLDSAEGANHSLVVNTTGGATIFGGEVGGDALADLSDDGGLGSITTNSNGTTEINGGLVRTTGSQSYNDPVFLGADTLLEGVNISFFSIDGQNNDLTITDPGDTILAGNVINIDNFTANGGGTTFIDTSSFTTLNNQTYDDDVVIEMNTTLTSSMDGNIVFNGNLDADSTANDRTLTINTGGVTRFGDESADAVGSMGAFESIETDAPGRLEIYASSIMTDGASITFNDPLLLFSDLTITESGSGDVTFDDVIESADGFNFMLTVNTAGGDVIFGGDIGADVLGALSSDTGLGFLKTFADGGTTFLGDGITTTGGVTIFNDLVLTDGAIINGGSGRLLFAGTIDSDGTPRDLTLITTYAPVDPEEALERPAVGFGGSIGASSPLASLTINDGLLGANPVPTTSTIVFATGFDMDGFIDADATDVDTIFQIRVADFTMGQGQKMLTLGHLDLGATGTATLGDLTTVGDMCVDAATIQIHTRDAGAVAELMGSTVVTTLMDSSVDFVSGGVLKFTSAQMLLNGGPNPLFANPSAVFNGTPSGVVLAYPDPINKNTFNGLGDRLFAFDLRAEGASPSNPSEALAGLVKINIPEVPTESVLGLALKKQLEEIEIWLRDLSAQELIDALIGRGLYNDRPQVVYSEGAADRPASVARISPDIAFRILDNAKVIKDNSEGWAAAILEAWEQYVGAIGDVDPDAEGFGKFVLEQPASSVARQAFDHLAQTYLYVDQSGLTQFETKYCKAALVRGFQDRQISIDLVQAVEAFAAAKGAM